MRLLDNEPQNRDELVMMLKNKPGMPDEYSIAVEGLVFNSNYEWILEHRGGKACDEVGKYEGIGGRFENDKSFREALEREIREEVGDDADIRILRFLEVKHDIVNKIR